MNVSQLLHITDISRSPLDFTLQVLLGLKQLVTSLPSFFDSRNEWNSRWFKCVMQLAGLQNDISTTRICNHDKHDTLIICDNIRERNNAVGGRVYKYLQIAKQCQKKKNIHKKRKTRILLKPWSSQTLLWSFPSPSASSLWMLGDEGGVHNMILDEVATKPGKWWSLISASSQ